MTETMFKLSLKQSNKVVDFIKAQKKINSGAIGGEITYEFTPTTVGTVIIVTYCKGTDVEAVVDVTDYDEW